MEATPTTSFFPNRRANMALSPKSKRRQLDLVKCECCRNDKQKCLPINREWPMKCNRCRSKGFACSKGTRATWKRKRDQNDKPRDGQPDEEWHLKWPFFLNFHKMMTMAIMSLRNVKEDHSRLFGVTMRQMAKTSGDQNECAEFEVFVHTLGQMILTKAKEFVAASRTATTSLLASFLMDDYSVSSAVSTLCPICDIEDHAMELLDTHDERHGIDILARIGRWSAHCQHLDYRPEEEHAEDESLILRGQLADFRQRFWEELDYLPEDLFTAGVPNSVRDFPAFVPEDFSLTPFGRLHASSKDCLGRNWLHQLFDIKAEHLGAAPKERIESILQESNLTEMYLDMQDILGRTPLHIACGKGYEGAVSILLQDDTDQDMRTIYGSTPLHYAAASGSLDICRILLIKANINAKDKFGATPLHYAVVRNHEPIVEFLLSNPTINPNNCGPEGSEPLLIYFIKQDHEELVKLLLDRGADPNVSYQGTAAIYRAIRMMNPNILRYMIESDPYMANTKDSTGTTPLGFSAYYKFDEVVCYLSTLPNIDLNTTNNYGYTPLMQAARAGATAIVDFLSDIPEVDLGVQDKEGRTAVDLARSFNYINIVELIVYKLAARAG